MKRLQYILIGLLLLLPFCFGIGSGGFIPPALDPRAVHIEGEDVQTKATFADADASPASVGETLYDNVVTGLLNGAWVWHDGAAARYFVDLITLPVNDDYVVAYDAAADGFYMKVDSGAAGGDSWGDPVDADILPTGNDNTYDLGSAAASFADVFWDGMATGNVTGALTGNADTVTNGVYTTDNISALAATTSAQLYGVLSDETGSGAGALAVFNQAPTIDSPTFTTAITAVDLLDFTEFADAMTLDTDTSIAFGSSGLTFIVANPASPAFDINGTGAFSSDLLHVHQHTGNPTGGNLIHAEAEDADVSPLVHINVLAVDTTATDVVGLLIDTDVDDDADFIPMEVRDDSGVANDLLWQMDSTGTVQTGIWDAGAVTSSGAVQGTSVTDGTATLTGGALTGLTTPLTVDQGGTGRATSTTAYGLIAAGTTATGVHQTLAAGATTEILVGAGGAALPVWTTATGSGAPMRGTAPTITTGITITGADHNPAAAGEIRYDTTIAEMSGGVMRWFDDDSVRMLVDLETDVVDGDDDKVVAYDSAADGFYMKDDATGAGGGDPVLVNTVAVVDAAGIDLTNGTGVTITHNAGASPETATFAATLGTTIAAAEMADEDHGDVAWSSGTASVESMDLGDASTGTYYVGLFADDTGTVRPIYADAPLSYVQATGILSATGFTDGTATLTGGALTGLTTPLTVAQGGSGAASFTDGFVLLGSGANAFTPLDLTEDGAILIGDGAGDPVALDVGSSAGITILGTVATGVWNAGAVTSSGILTGTGLTAGAAVLTEAELETLDGITPGTAAASKALVLGASGEIATITTATITTATITNNIKDEPKHLRFNIFNPLAVQTDDTQVCIIPLTDAALTITNIKITLDAAGNEVAGDLMFADTFIGLANATVINVCDTTSGVLDDSAMADGTIPSGKTIYFQFDSAPDTAITQMIWDITYSYD